MLALTAGCGDNVIPPVPTPEPKIDSPDALIDYLAFVYRERDVEGFASILANDPDHAAVYTFRLSAPDSTGAVEWTREEEIRVHRNMFDPDSSLPPPMWLTALSASFTQVTAWEERDTLYRSDSNPTGLPPEKWKAVDARYSTYVFLDTQTDNDFLVEGEIVFTVIEDLEKRGTTPGRFLLFRAQDIDRTWERMKEPYR